MAKKKNFWLHLQEHVLTKEGFPKKTGLVYIVIIYSIYYFVPVAGSYILPSKAVIAQEKYAAAIMKDAEAREVQNELILDSASVQFSARIDSNIPTDKPLTTDGLLIAQFQIHNTSTDTVIPPSKESKNFSGHQIYSIFSLHFIDIQGKDISKPKEFIIEKPILVGGASDLISLREKIPPGTSTIQGTLDCLSIDQYKPCKQPILESITYTLSPTYLKVLVVDASREKDKINVPGLRTEIEKIYGNSNFMKASASSTSVGPTYAKQPILIYNADRKHNLDSEHTKLLESALNEAYGEFYHPRLIKMDSYSFNIVSNFLSDSVKDGDNQSNHKWDNLEIKFNRFSPNILTQNPDIDFVIFLPSNT